MDISFILIVFSFIFLNIDLVFPSNYYRKYTLEAYDLCAAYDFKKIVKVLKDFVNRGPEIELKNDYPAFIIQQTWNSTYKPNIKSNCSFRITNKRKKGGIYIVLTKLKFRRHPITNECIDYIIFSKTRTSRKTRICESYDTLNSNKQSFYDFNEKVYVTVFINDQYEITEPLELQFIATPHFECSDYSSNSVNIWDIGKNDDDDESTTTEGISLSNRIRHSDSNEFQCDSDKCISNVFVYDGIKNCLLPCRDEGGCSTNSISNEEIIDTSNIVVSALTSLIVTMIVVIIFLWICWKYKTTCLNQQNNQNVHRDEQQNTHHNGVISNHYHHDQAPNYNSINHNQSQRPPSPKDDLPPSYESLFPDR